MDSQTAKGKYDQYNSIKFETENVKSSLCDHSDAFVLVIEDIKVAGNNNADVALKNCAPSSTCKTKINNVFVDEESHI